MLLHFLFLTNRGNRNTEILQDVIFKIFPHCAPGSFGNLARSLILQTMKSKHVWTSLSSLPGNYSCI